MAWALLCGLVVAAEKPLSFDRAVDVEVAWDLIDLPFTIDAKLLSKKSALLLQDWQSDDDFGFGTPLDKELQALHDQFTSILTNSDASHKAATRKAARLRGAVIRPPPTAAPLAAVWDSDDEDSRATWAAAIAPATPSADHAAWDVASGQRTQGPTALDEDHEDSPRWDLATGQRRASQRTWARGPVSAQRAAPGDGGGSSFSPHGLSGSKMWTDFETRFGSDADAISALRSSSPRESPSASTKTTGGLKKPLVWMHVHKAGGSLMCQLAKKHERVVSPDENCNWKGHDGYEESGKAYKRVPCAERAKAFHSRGFTYGQVEREMDDNEVCSDFRYGVMLREPMSLMHSLLNYEIWYTAKFDHHPMNIPSDMRSWIQGKIDDQAVPGDQHAAWVHMDNFQTRVLANAFDVPAGQINAEHLDRARTFLQNNGFMVRILEDLPTQGESLFNELGWAWEPGALHRKVNKLAMEERPFMPEEKDYLKELNKYDYELYNGMRSSE